MRSWRPLCLPPLCAAMRTVGCAGQSVTDEQPQRLHMFSHRARRKSPARIRARQAATRKDAGESIADHKHRWENDTPAGRLMPFGVAPLVAAEGSPAASQTRRHSQFCTPGSRATMITQAGHASKRVKPTQPTGRSPQPSRRRAPACFQRPPPTRLPSLHSSLCGFERALHLVGRCKHVHAKYAATWACVPPRTRCPVLEVGGCAPASG